jgi:hypothetical protein
VQRALLSRKARGCTTAADAAAAAAAAPVTLLPLLLLTCAANNSKVCVSPEDSLASNQGRNVSICAAGDLHAIVAHHECGAAEGADSGCSGGCSGTAGETHV